MLSQLFKIIMNHVACNVFQTELFYKNAFVNSAVSTFYNALQKQLFLFTTISNFEKTDITTIIQGFFLFLKLDIHEDVYLKW